MLKLFENLPHYKIDNCIMLIFHSKDNNTMIDFMNIFFKLSL